MDGGVVVGNKSSSAEYLPEPQKLVLEWEAPLPRA